MQQEQHVTVWLTSIVSHKERTSTIMKLHAY